MSSKRNTGKNSIGPNQPPMQEVKNSATTSKKCFEVPSNFIASQYTEIYTPEIPTQPNLVPSYTFSPKTLLQTKSFEVLLQKSLCIIFPILKLISFIIILDLTSIILVKLL